MPTPAAIGNHVECCSSPVDGPSRPQLGRLLGHAAIHAGQQRSRDL
jgi:hypothetical protein